MLLGFKPRFVEPILMGTKDQSIRKPRKHPGKVGDTLYLYTGLRRPGARKIAEVVCTEVLYVTLALTPFHFAVILNDPAANTIKRLERMRDLDEFARRDGFSCWHELMGFWNEHHKGVEVFEGHVYRWNPAAHGLRP